MKLFKSIFSVAIVCVMIFCIGAGAFADGADTYSITIPDGFTLTESDGQSVWKNESGDIVIEIAVKENTSNVKVNPNEAGESYVKLLEEKFKASVTSGVTFSAQVLSTDSGFVELGEHDAIRVSLTAKYTFEKGEMSVYRSCYLFETENYIHAFVITGDKDIAEFADSLIKTVKINDTAVALRGDGDKGVFGGIVGGVLKGALIGAAVGVVLALAKKFTGKKDEASDVEITEQPQDDTDETNFKT